MRSLLMNGAGLLVSVAFVFAVIACATALLRMRILSAQSARKAIHITLSHWWLIASAMIDDPWIASVGPACSLLSASLLPTSRLLPVVEGTGPGRDRGTICYSAALLILVNLSWRGLIPAKSAAIGVLVMGWGDGLAGLVGDRWGKNGALIWGRNKSIQGAAAMFLASALVTLVVTLVSTPPVSGFPSILVMCCATAGVAAGLELFTPFGVDNLTIPLGTALFFVGAFG